MGGKTREKDGKFGEAIFFCLVLGSQTKLLCLGIEFPGVPSRGGCRLIVLLLLDCNMMWKIYIKWAR